MTQKELSAFEMVSFGAKKLRFYADGIIGDVVAIETPPVCKTASQYYLDEAEIALVHALQKVRETRRKIETAEAA